MTDTRAVNLTWLHYTQVAAISWNDRTGLASFLSEKYIRLFPLIKNYIILKINLTILLRNKIQLKG